MSSAGHVLDMIARMKNNRALKEQNLSKYQKIENAYQKHKNIHRAFYDKNKLSEKEIQILKNDIKQRMVTDQRNRLIKTVLLISVISIVTTIGFYIFLKDW
ncbi:hypothetical protein [Plebeiibacterium sediminum]|uniref:Uncharacterized protein n=1 Tax=Plebeiibacterium sediminum TaxID=2992112 RepID=A0AAE3M2W7_9BACT|nr:hypothetical protein [Plebeiobacterium sediminum]MCW3786134.1 hypothetical protein [Plebeiobacterium sediminum]